MSDRDPLSFRDRRLVLSIVGAVVEAEGPMPEVELADLFAGRQWSTVGRVLRELVGYGVLHVSSRREGGGVARCYVVTPLGLAWVGRVVAPWPWVDADPAAAG